MMFLTQMSGTVLQSLRLIDTGGIIMKATIISAFGGTNKARSSS